MDPSIAASLIAVASGASGYLLREYRNRARPFIALEDISGDIQRNIEEVAIPSEIRDLLAASFYIQELPAEANLRAVDTAWDRSDDLVVLWPELRQRIDRLLAAPTDDERRIAIPLIFQAKLLDKLILPLLFSDKIPLAPIPPGTPEWIAASYDEKTDGGCVWFEFPGQAFNFGMAFGHATVRSKCQPFVDMVRFMQLESLKKALTAFRGLVESEYHIAIQVAKPLKLFLNEQLRWSFQFFYANLSGQPIVIHPSCQLLVVDPAGVKIREECYFAYVRESSDGKETWSDAKSPLILRPHSELRLVAITTRRQGKMDLGNALRQVFDRGEGKARLMLEVTKVGLLKRQKIRTPTWAFKSTQLRKGAPAPPPT